MSYGRKAHLGTYRQVRRQSKKGRGRRPYPYYFTAPRPAISMLDIALMEPGDDTWQRVQEELKKPNALLENNEWLEAMRQATLTPDIPWFQVRRGPAAWIARRWREIRTWWKTEGKETKE